MSFKGELGKAAKAALEKADKERRAICVELFKSVVMDTPVDTGRLRGNWQLTINSPNYSEIERTEKNWSAVVAQETQDLGRLVDTVHMTNNLPYAHAIEYGHSKQKAPAGMVRKNVARIKSLIRTRKLSR